MKITIDKPQAIWQIGQRDNQEDAIYPKLGKATSDDRLFILCDGMGGHEHGEVASNTVCTAMSDYIKSHADMSAAVPDSLLLEALDAAYQQLDKADDGNVRKMGTTLCLLLFHHGGLTAMHVGDSRIYHIRPTADRVLYQSRDHSMVYDLYQAGEITFEEMRTSPQKNVITRALQPGEDNRVKPAIVHIANIQPGDYFYICSDGMLEQMEKDELQQLLAADKSDDEKCQQLISLTANNHDNHSAYLIHVNGVSLEQGDNLVDDEQTTPDNAINIVPRVLDAEEGNDVDVVEVEQAATPTTQPTPAQPHKSSLVPVIVAAVVVALIVVVYSFVRKGNKDNEQPENKIEQTVAPSGTMQQEVVRPAAQQPEQVSARRVNVKQQKPATDDKKVEKAEQKEQAATAVEKENEQKTEESKGQTEPSHHKNVPRIGTQMPEPHHAPAPKEPDNTQAL